MNELEQKAYIFGMIFTLSTNLLMLDDKQLDFAEEKELETW